MNESICCVISYDRTLGFTKSQAKIKHCVNKLSFLDFIHSKQKRNNAYFIFQLFTFDVLINTIQEIIGVKVFMPRRMPETPHPKKRQTEGQTKTGNTLEAK